MTSRVRNHVLEDKSRAELINALPEQWVVHDIHKDYGVDVQVEIFSIKGDRTGMKFYGQLKATDKNIEDDVLQIDREHIDYWLNHSDPVIIFRYFEAKRSFRWCWIHNIAWRLKPDSKSIDISRYLMDWDKEKSTKEIEDYLGGRRIALSPLNPPYRIAVIDAAQGASRAAGVVAELSNALGEDAFRFLINPASQSNFQIYLESKTVAVSYCGLPGVVFDVEESSVVNEHVSAALIGLFLCAHRYNRSEICGLMLTKALPRLYRAAGNSELIKSHLFTALIYSLGLERAVFFADPIIKGGEDPSANLTLFHLAAAKLASREENRDFYIKMLKQWSGDVLLESNKAMLSYNLGNALSHLGKWSEAREEYARALAAEPHYADRDYFWEEFGAANFEAGELQEAIECYQRAIALGASQYSHWKIGDAYFNLGQYKKAFDSFSIAFKDKELKLSDANQFLLQFVCNDLIVDWGINSQTLADITPEEISSIGSKPFSKSKEEFQGVIRPLIEKNAIDPLLNFNAGIFAARSGLPGMALIRHLVCALRQRADAEAWVNALLNAFNANMLTLMPLIAATAKFYCGGDFIRELERLISSSDCPHEMKTKFKEAILDMLSKIDDETPDSDKKVTLRVWTRSDSNSPPIVEEIAGSDTKK